MQFIAMDDFGGDAFDTVTDEVQRWATLDKKIIAEYRDDAGIVNEVMFMFTPAPDLH
jgi:hypothetical protein